MYILHRAAAGLNELIHLKFIELWLAHSQHTINFAAILSLPELKKSSN